MKIRRFRITAGGTPSERHRLQGFQTEGHGATSAPAGGTAASPDAVGRENERDDDVPFLGMIGVAVRPVIRAGLRALGVVDDDDSTTLLALFDRAIAHATEVAAGETRVYSPQQPAVRVSVGPIHVEVYANVTGELRLLPDSGASYAGQSVARNTDAVNAVAAMTTWFTQVKAVCDALAPGVVTSPAPIGIGTITGSLSKVKA